MLKWAVIFFLISLVAGFFGFRGVESGSQKISKILFFIAIAIFIVIVGRFNFLLIVYQKFSKSNN